MRQLKINKGYSKNPNTGELERTSSDDAIQQWLKSIQDEKDFNDIEEAAKKSAMITTRAGTRVVTYDNENELRAARGDSNVSDITTSSGKDLKERKANVRLDYPDLDKDGDTKESMKKAAADKKKKETNESKDVTLPADTSFTVDLKHLMQKHGKDNTIKLSKALMKKLHDKGEISVNGTTITFKPSSKEETNENVEMQTLDVEVPLTNDFGRQDEPNYIDDEGRMAKSQLHKMREYTDKLTAMLDDNTQLEGWVQAKLTKASDYLSAVFHYLDYEMERRGEGETSVEQD